ncbi:hypothetical protein [Bradyrhizobium sp. Ash2021]|uniref:hypothetical protein n=1 Tax=Bradyrhizobium sp. Ash2021 TaxID=2954771 RepID=UPI002816506A|nr:hypothetical protein [Bradyrhizobium sp. Ash2021]WMT75991.1 hypothetical protein NL528_06290 [Bradyrhizobium sp. Ash2021]
MYEHPIEDVHRLIDTVEEATREIDRAPTDSIQIQQIPELSAVILELLGWTNTAYMENELSINPSVLSKFVKMRGVVRKPLARKVADRLRSYLKSQDQAFLQPDVMQPPNGETKTKPKSGPIGGDTFVGEQWVAVRTASEIKMKIGAISSLLDSIIVQTKGANEPADQQVLTEIERQQLIAILETALNVLRSPLIEKGLLKKAQMVLKRGAENATEKGVQQGLGKLMDGAGARIVELIAMLFS